jgi:mannose PTS system EIIA component
MKFICVLEQTSSRQNDHLSLLDSLCTQVIAALLRRSMIGLVVASHGRLAEEMLSTAQLIVGEFENTICCSVVPGTAPEELQSQLRAAVKTVDQGQGVIVFADLLGGSPCTQSLSLCRQAKIEVLTGVNLPMLLKANGLRMSLSVLTDLAHELVQYGQRNIACATDAMRSKGLHT